MWLVPAEMLDRLVAYPAGGGMVLMMMDYKVYVLYSKTLDKHYVGCTKDIQERLSRHNTGRSKFTSRGMPWVIIKTYTCNTLSEARRLEKTIKGRGISRYLKENI